MYTLSIILDEVPRPVESLSSDTECPRTHISILVLNHMASLFEVTEYTYKFAATDIQIATMVLTTKFVMVSH